MLSGTVDRVGRSRAYASWNKSVADKVWSFRSPLIKRFARTRSSWYRSGDICCIVMGICLAGLNYHLQYERLIHEMQPFASRIRNDQIICTNCEFFPFFLSTDRVFASLLRNVTANDQYSNQCFSDCFGNEVYSTVSNSLNQFARR